MKKITLLFMFIFLFSTPILAQENKEIERIQKVLEKYERGFAERNLNSMVSQLSRNYMSKNKIGAIENYDQKKYFLEENIGKFFEKYTNYSFNNLKIIKSDINGDIATVLFQFKRKISDLDSGKEINSILKKQVSLVKENGGWKITSIKFAQKKVKAMKAKHHKKEGNLK